MPDQDQFNIPAAGAAMPEQVQGQLQGFLDVIPPHFPEGAEIIIMRPGQLEPAGRITLPVGCLLLLAHPEMAVHLRAQAKAMREAFEKMMANAANGVGRRG